MSDLKNIYVVTGWMCQVDFQYELGNAAQTEVYSCEKTLRKRRKCVEECGVEEVVVLRKKDYELILKGYRSYGPATC